VTKLNLDRIAGKEKVLGYTDELRLIRSDMMIDFPQIKGKIYLHPLQFWDIDQAETRYGKAWRIIFKDPNGLRYFFFTTATSLVNYSKDMKKDNATLFFYIVKDKSNKWNLIDCNQQEYREHWDLGQSQLTATK